MSQRGSFVTEYIYCNECLNAAIHAFDVANPEKYLTATLIPSWQGARINLPIIAGKVGGNYPGHEMHIMEEVVEFLAPLLCHPLRIAVLPDDGAPVRNITVEPIAQQ